MANRAWPRPVTWQLQINCVHAHQSCPAHFMSVSSPDTRAASPWTHPHAAMPRWHCIVVMHGPNRQLKLRTTHLYIAGMSILAMRYIRRAWAHMQLHQRNVTEFNATQSNPARRQYRTWNSAPAPRTQLVRCRTLDCNCNHVNSKSHNNDRLYIYIGCHCIYATHHTAIIQYTLLSLWKRQCSLS